MFKSADLSLIVEFMLMFYKDKPIDWLLDHIMWVKVCNPEKDAVSSCLLRRPVRADRVLTRLSVSSRNTATGRRLT